ncbi:MAG: cell division FtsA domain-containing protein [Christensenellales bacterium]|jgi:cell division protein FtsA
MGKTVAALDFGTSKVSAVIGRIESRGSIAILGVGSVPYAGFRNNEWIEPEALAADIRKARKRCERRAHRRMRELYVVVPGEFTETLLRQVTMRPSGMDGLITREDMDTLSRMAADYDKPVHYRLLHLNLLGASLDGTMVWQDPAGQMCSEVTAYLSCISADGLFMESIEELLGEMGLGVVEYVAAPLSTGRMVAESVPPDHTVIVIDSGYFTSDLIVIRNGSVLHHENIELGGGHITSDLAVELGLSMYDAEFVKRRNPVGMATGAAPGRMAVDWSDRKLSVRMDDARAVMERRIEELAGIVSRSLMRLGLEMGKLTDVFLTGGGVSLIRGARETISRELGVMVHHYIPKAPLLNSPVFTSAMGAVHWAFRNYTDPSLTWWDRLKKSFLEFI